MLKYFIAIFVLVLVWTSLRFGQEPRRENAAQIGINYPVDQSPTNFFDINYIPANERVSILWSSDEYGHIDSLRTIVESKDTHVNLEAVNAICTEVLTRVEKRTIRRTSFTHQDLQGSKTLKTLAYEKFPKLNGRAYLTYYIPVAISTRYPDLFSLSELQSMANLRTIHIQSELKQQPTDFQEASQKLIALSNDWIRYSSCKRINSRAEILEIAKTLSDKYELLCIN